MNPIREVQKDPLAEARGHLADLSSCEEHKSVVGSVEESLARLLSNFEEEKTRIQEEAFDKGYELARREFASLIDRNAELEVRNTQLEREKEEMASRVTAAEEELQLDPKTRILNFEAFAREVKEFLYTGLRDKRDIEERRSELAAFWIIDLDRFKAINDLFGHPVGDMVILRLVDVLRTNIRKENVTHGMAADPDGEIKSYGHGSNARLGGDEFAVLQTKIRRPNEAYEAASRAKRMFHDIDWHRLDLNRFRPTVSIGVAILRVGSLRSKRPGGKGFEEKARAKAAELETQWYKAADAAMYKVKHRSHIGVCVLEYKERVNQLVEVEFTGGGPQQLMDLD